MRISATQVKLRTLSRAGSGACVIQQPQEERWEHQAEGSALSGCVVAICSENKAQRPSEGEGYIRTQSAMRSRT